MSVSLLFGNEARKRMLTGVEKLDSAVRVTMGPAGRLAIFRHFGQVYSTKDGVTVAKEVVLKDEFEAMGADMAKGAARQAVDAAGDGTTTAILLVHELFKSGVEAIEDGCDPVHLSRGMVAATEAIVGKVDPHTKRFTGGLLETLAVSATPEMAYHVAKISANGDEAIAKVVSDAVLAVGPDGAISMANSPTPEHSFDKADGLQLDSPLIHPAFINDPERNRVVFDDAFVLILNRRLSTQHEAVGILQQALKIAEHNKKSPNLVIVVDDIDKEALGCLLKNKFENGIPVAVVGAPAWGDARRDLLDDLAVVTGGVRIDRPMGENYSQLLGKHLGVVARVTLTPQRAIFTAADIGPLYRSQIFEPHVARIRAAAEDTTQHPAELERYKSRLSALAGGVAVVKVGGTSQDNVTEAKFRVEDAIHATRAAIAEGVVPGGGNALRRVSDMLPEVEEGKSASFERGWELVAGAIIAPYHQILKNAAIDYPNNLVDIDASTGKPCKDLIAAGIVDPLKVVRSALNAASSHATLMLQTETIMAQEPQTPAAK